MIGGKWQASGQGGATFDVSNPATGEVIATLPDMTRADVARAIDTAFRSQNLWAKKTGKERAAVPPRLHDLMAANADDLATILTTEMSKPLAEAKGEILYNAAYVEWFGEEAKRVYGDTILGHQLDERLIEIKQPIGVVASITLRPAVWSRPRRVPTEPRRSSPVGGRTDQSER